MIVVLDTNVIVSALLTSSGSPAKIIDLWEKNEFEVTVSIQLLHELEHTLTYPKINNYLKWSRQAIAFFLEHYAKFANVVDPQFELEIIENDPDDNRVLECAVAGGASYIVTGDNHLLNLKEYQGIMILPPVGFLTLLKTDEEKGKTS